MNKHMTQEVAIKSAWMILEVLGFSREINGDLEKTVTAVYESAPAADVAEVRHGRWIAQPPDLTCAALRTTSAPSVGKNSKRHQIIVSSTGRGWKVGNGAFGRMKITKVFTVRPTYTRAGC